MNQILLKSLVYDLVYVNGAEEKYFLYSQIWFCSFSETFFVKLCSLRPAQVWGLSFYLCTLLIMDLRAAFLLTVTGENQEATFRAEKLSPLPLRATWVGLLLKSYKPLKCRLNSFREHADSLVQKMIWGCVENFKMHSRLHPLLMHWTGPLSLSTFWQTKCLNILWLFFLFFVFFSFFFLFVFVFCFFLQMWKMDAITTVASWGC